VAPNPRVLDRLLYLYLYMCCRCNEWLQIIGRTDLIGKDEYIKKSCRICSGHFDESQFVYVQQRQLLPDAMPLPRVSLFHFTN